MDIPQKDYDVLSGRHKYRESRVSPLVIFVIVSGIATAVFFIAGIKTRTSANRRPEKATTRTTSERSPVKVIAAGSTGALTDAENNAALTDDGTMITQAYAETIREAMKNGDSNYIADAGALFYYNAKGDELKKLGIMLIEYAESLKTKSIKENPLAPSSKAQSNESKVKYEILGNRFRRSGNKITEKDREYYRQEWAALEARLDKEMQGKRLDRLIDQMQYGLPGVADNYEEQLRKERQARIDTEKRTRREATTKRLRMGQDKAGISTPVEIIRRPRKRIK